ncbi:hypothetical protein LPBF_03775 [Flavobacterium crassostreae]|uniref:Uncharacterized protein n=1 Tax=Flavobacterium crassostreae TaxID=1763534 RepID=A0A1B9E7Z4_9FLAO|nr:hypothetical protein LPBF_03775 [Flavobacterium crassostreae]
MYRFVGKPTIQKLKNNNMAPNYLINKQIFNLFRKLVRYSESLLPIYNNFILSYIALLFLYFIKNNTFEH